MTAEIVVMNREAVAFAADSAVTFQAESLSKVSTEANKIFKLSMKRPVGIMIYGNSMIMGLPWETLVKSYRASRGGKKFDSVEEYGSDFINYLTSDDVRYDVEAENIYMKLFTISALSRIKDNIDEMVADWLRDGHKLDKTTIKYFTKETITGIYKEYRDNSEELIPIKLTKKLVGENWNLIEDFINNLFVESNVIATIVGVDVLTKEIKEKLKQILIHMLSKNLNQGIVSGVVIAGFGDKEFTPSTVDYEIEGMIDRTIKYEKGRSYSVGGVREASIRAFAQREMTVRFMEGVDPLYKAYEDEYLGELCKDYAQKVIDNISGYSVAQKRRLKQKIERQTKNSNY